MWLTLWSDLSFNIQLFNVPLSGTARVSRYQKKHSLTPRIYTDNKVCFELDPIKPAYNQSAGWPAHINSQCLQPTMDQYAGSPGRSTYCHAELAESFVNFLHHYSPSSGFYGTGKDNRGSAPTIRLDATPSGLLLPPPPSSSVFMSNALYVTSLLIYPGCGQAPNNAGLHTQWISYQGMEL